MTDEPGIVDDSDILNEIVELTTPEFRQPGDFTMGEYIERWTEQNGTRISTAFATRWLNDLIEKGELEKVDRVLDTDTNRRCTVYRKAKQDDEDNGMDGA